MRKPTHPIGNNFLIQVANQLQKRVKGDVTCRLFLLVEETSDETLL
jgi:hypothetical protein